MSAQVKLGDSGDDVRTLQDALRARGYYAQPAVIDGAFGPATEAAVRAFQRTQGLTVDGIAGHDTLSALLDPTNKVVASMRFPPAVSQWAAPLMACQMNHADSVPIERALRWIQLESGGNACATGRILGDHVMEAGIAQSYFETPTSTVGGFTSKQLRAVCGCEGTSQHGAPCSDEAMQVHAQVAIVDIKAHRARARAKLAAAGLHVDESTPDFACYWKLVHALPGVYSFLRPAMLAVGTMMTWADFKAWVLGATPAKLAAIDSGTARYAGSFARVFDNCEKFAAG